MRVVMFAPEVHPYAKTGGLADVLAALPPALTRMGVEVSVCLPAYRTALRALGPLPVSHQVHAPVSSRMEPAEILAVPDAPVPTFLVRADRFFDRDGLYGVDGQDYGDNAERFAFFCRAALEWLRHVLPAPDVLHLHDWQTALISAFLRTTEDHYPELAATRTVVTVHNLAYQGRFPAADWHLLNLDPRHFVPDGLEFYGDISYLKAGLLFADAITTVSPRYAEEIRTPSFGAGLDGVLRLRADRLRGILNGVDDAVWNPATDPLIPARYDRESLAGKRRCKAALQHELGLTMGPEPTLLAVVSRLVEQKGLDLLVAVLPELLETRAVQFAALGSGEPRYEEMLTDLAERFPGQVGVRIGFDEGLAHRIEAGADVFLMPSRFEPCGLNQLYSLRYGTVPVVHATGGLDDTVVEFDPETGVGTGFKFTPFTPEAFLAALRRALDTRREAPAWQRLITSGMAQDFSWSRAAREYARLYASIAA
ncbi:MAG TPA: glycogen synthase GlgA [Candidatus Binatus sp.]|jgi:starch synthase|nr:glycogen synthase GlgA [Candidatus Binatus sp.]